MDAHTSTELAAEKLREAILSGDLRPGEKLHQDKLAEMLGISRTPLRTALTTLSQTGLVSYESNRGYYVREFSFADVEGAFTVRAELEATACRLAAANMTPEAGRHLQELVEEGDRLLAGGCLPPENLAPYRRMNVSFHTTVMTVAANPWIREFVERLHTIPMASDRVIMWRDFDVIRRSHDDHHRIARALACRQAERAAALMREHIVFALEHLRTQLDLHPEDFLRVPTADTAKRKTAATRTRRKAE